ncbi:recombinase family protein [Nonomuraea bangladeshensis]
MTSCAAPAGSPCRTGKGKVAVQHDIARFRLVPALAKALSVATPLVRKPGTLWIELPRPAPAGAEPAGHVRIGYARASTVRQSLDTQLDAFKAAGVARVFAEKISTRAVVRPELERAIDLAAEMRASGLASSRPGPRTRSAPEAGSSSNGGPAWTRSWAGSSARRGGRAG